MKIRLAGENVKQQPCKCALQNLKAIFGFCVSNVAQRGSFWGHFKPYVQGQEKSDDSLTLLCKTRIC